MDHNTRALAEMEVRLIEARCASFYRSKNGDEHDRMASAAIDHLAILRRQLTKKQPAARAASTGGASRSRHDTQRAKMRFQEADRDGDQSLGFEEFYSTIFPRSVREANGVDTIREWFNAADTDGNATLSINEFFVWTLRHAASKHGAPSLQTLCERFDLQRNGSLDLLEFETLCKSVGFGAHAATIFDDLDVHGHREVRYAELELKILDRVTNAAPGAAPGGGGGAASRPLSAITKEMISSLIWSTVEQTLSKEAEAELAQISSEWRVTATDAAGVRAQLQTLLRRSGVSL